MDRVGPKGIPTPEARITRRDPSRCCMAGKPGQVHGGTGRAHPQLGTQDFWMMNLQDALVVLLEATREQSEQRAVRNARKRVEQKVEALRLKKERAARKQNDE